MAERNLADARIEALSTDGKFGHAYEAARALATVVVRASGYRVKSAGAAHYSTFVALEVADPRRFARHAAYFNTCREKRNDLSYELAGVVTDSEAEELLREVPAFQALVDEWLRARHPKLV